MDELVWVPSPTEAYVLGRIVDIQVDSAVVQTLTGSAKLTVPYATLLPADNPSRPDVDDNCSLVYLNEASLLENIRRRYFTDKIYTYVGNILIAVNPYKQIDNLYDVDCIKQYNDKSLGLMPPHVFAIADNAHRSLKFQKASQAIIVSGESGAGKTECTKHILRYLTENWGTSAGPVEQRILDSNPLLEAFGNAKTRRNNNSSRFGKFIELHFWANSQVAGAHISHYLLEKSRVCLQNPYERSFHIFYQMCAGLIDEGMRSELAIGDPTEFAYLRGGCAKFFRRSTSDPVNNKSDGIYLKNDLLDDAADFAKTTKAMAEMGLAKEQNAIFRILSAILHLGNVEFVENELDRKGGCVVDENKSGKSISVVSSFLGVEKAALCVALTTRTITSTEGVKVNVQLSSQTARNARDALAKAIYSRLFDFVVGAVNASLPFDQTSASQFIGVLDIAGFEYFDVNNFEQFCVNYCNERLQQFFTLRVLKSEQDLYEHEKLAFRRIHFIDNEDCIELLDARPDGIFCLLDEESKFPKPGAEHFTQEVHRKHATHFRLCVPRKSKLKAHKEVRDEEGFVIRHYAGAVCYTTAGFLEKNNDALHASLEGLVHSSSNAFLQRLFNDSSQDKAAISHHNTGNGKVRQGSVGSVPNKLAFVSISAKFRDQLQVLLMKLQLTGTHFIRCIKPNSAMAPQKFEPASVLSQLQASGMIDALRLMQQGYPSRVGFTDFYNLYKGHLSADLARLDARMFCRALCKAVGMAEGDFTFGTTKIFFRSGRFAEVDHLLQTEGQHLQKLIDGVRHWIIRARWRKAQVYTICAVRVRDRMVDRKKQAIIIEKMVRGLMARRQVRARIKGFMSLKLLRQRLVQDVAKSVEKLKDDARKQTDDELTQLTNSIDGLLADMRQVKNGPRLNKNKVDGILIAKTNDLEQFIQKVEKRLIDQNNRDAELERLRKLEEELAEEKRRREEEEAERKRLEEQQREEEAAARKIVQAAAERQKADAERLLQQGITKRTALDEEDARLAKRLQELVDHEDENVQLQRNMQEKLDRELALRLANGNQDDTNISPTSEDSSPRGDQKKLVVALPPPATNSGRKKYDVANWKYAELRDIINTSCDLELIEECRQEFHRRLRIYHEWKMRNRGREENAVSAAQDRMPGSVMNHALLTKQSVDANFGDSATKSLFNTPLTLLSQSKTQSKEPAARQRYFRLPLKQLGPRGTTYTTGWWFAHFDGQWIARQLEIRDHNHPVLKLAGIDDMSMCEFKLADTGLESRPDAEIPEHQFEYEWNRNYGLEYMMSNAGSVSSPYLKVKLRQAMQKTMAQMQTSANSNKALNFKF